MKARTAIAAAVLLALGLATPAVFAQGAKPPVTNPAAQMGSGQGQQGPGQRQLESKSQKGSGQGQQGPGQRQVESKSQKGSGQGQQGPGQRQVEGKAMMGIVTLLMSI